MYASELLISTTREAASAALADCKHNKCYSCATLENCSCQKKSTTAPSSLLCWPEKQCPHEKWAGPFLFFQAGFIMVPREKWRIDMRLHQGSNANIRAQSLSNTGYLKSVKGKPVSPVAQSSAPTAPKTDLGKRKAKKSAWNRMLHTCCDERAGHLSVKSYP